MLVYTISKGTNKSYVYDIYRGARGEKGDQGPQGEQGIQGLPGTAATIQVGNVTSGAAPSVVNSGTPNAAILDFVLERGEKGEQGDKGQAAGFGTPTSSVTSLPAGSQATVSVTATGDATQKVFDFDFGIPSGAKGDTGAKGDKGDKGDTGDAAGFGTPTISVTSLPAGSTATATVSATGPDTAKVFDFDFGIPTGSNAWNIEVSYFTSSTMVLKAFKNNEAYSGTIFAYLTYGDGTTSQRTSNPMMLTATSGTITITSNEFSDIATVLADTTKTNFYFEFQETFTGSIFYTVNYVRNGAGDVWQLNFLVIDDGQFAAFKIYKNGEEQTTGNFYGRLIPRSGNGTSSGSRTSIATYNDYRWNCNFTPFVLDESNVSAELEIYSDSSYQNFLCSDSILLRTLSISSSARGFTTGSQVYSYVDTQIGNINTILQSI